MLVGLAGVPAGYYTAGALTQLIFHAYLCQQTCGHHLIV
jgi:hypothetical protein